jgi:hypothetical protein
LELHHIAENKSELIFAQGLTVATLAKQIKQMILNKFELPARCLQHVVGDTAKEWSQL